MLLFYGLWTQLEKHSADADAESLRFANLCISVRLLPHAAWESDLFWGSVQDAERTPVCAACQQ